MKSIGKFVAAVGAIFAATTGAAFANLGLNVPEPGSLALVGLAIGVLIAVSRRGRK